MNDQSPELDLSTPADARGPLARRAVLAGTAFAVPAVAMAVATPASAASTDFDLTFSTFALQSDVDSYNGRPKYGPTQTPYLNFTVYNAGTGKSPSTAVQLDFDSDHVSSVQAPSGWSETARYVNGRRLVSVLTYAGGGLAGKSSISAQPRFTIRTDSPYGTNASTVNASVQPTSGDVNSGNNSASGTFYDEQQRTHNLDFSVIAMQSDVSSYNGRPLYGANQNPFVDLEIRNAGPASVASASIVLDFPLSQVASATVSSGSPDWSMISDYTDKDRRVFRVRYNKNLAANARVAVRVFFTIQGNLPGGNTLAALNLTVEPGTGDSDWGNNQNGSSFYTLGPSAPVNQNFDIQFTDVNLPANAGGNNYNGVPLFRPNWEAYIEFKIYNGGPGTVTQPMAVVDFDASDTGVQRAYVSSSTPQWTQIQDWVANGRHYYRLRYSGNIGAGQKTDLCRVPFTIASKVPGGTAPGNVYLLAEPTQGDTYLDNNRSGGGYRTIA